jgi:hypothetical protein
MQDRTYGLRRIHFLRGWVNKGKRDPLLVQPTAQGR